MSSPDKERDITNVQDYIEHLSGIRFNGTLLVVFDQGSPKYVSRKEELSPELLDRFLHRPLIVRTKKPGEIPAVEPVESIEKTDEKTTPADPGKF